MPARRFPPILVLFWLPLCGQAPLCEPGPEVRAELAKVAAIPVDENALFDDKIAPYVRLRKAYPKDLFVEMAWQDATEEYGVQGLITAMLSETMRASQENPASLQLSYLFGRALEGITTPRSISIMRGILEQDPSYAPAHRTLAEIYGSKAFHDVEAEKTERARFLALCPGSTIAARPYPLPPRPTLPTETDAPARVPALFQEAMTKYNWRLQRMRPYDWYSVEEKKEAGREVQQAYWTGWGVLYEAYRKGGQTEKAAAQLADMEERFARTPPEPASVWRKAGAVMAEAYRRGGRPDKARETLERMK
jgi:tetratricopeptide (TPR) repeat protein